MKSLGSTGSFLWALLLVLLAFICTGNAFKQELWLYDAQDNSHLFHSHVPDTSDLDLFLPKVTRYCTKGVWFVFSTADFKAFETNFGSYKDKAIVCNNYTDAASIKSLRHLAASNTNTDALSLYEGNYNSGEEVFVTTRARTGITIKSFRIAISGTSDWMLFEGQDLDGKSTCYKYHPCCYLYNDYVSDLGLATIGSVFKGCDLQEIQNYKILNNSSFINSN